MLKTPCTGFPDVLLTLAIRPEVALVLALAGLQREELEKRNADRGRGRVIIEQQPLVRLNAIDYATLAHGPMRARATENVALVGLLPPAVFLGTLEFVHVVTPGRHLSAGVPIAVNGEGNLIRVVHERHGRGGGGVDRQEIK